MDSGLGEVPRELTLISAALRTLSLPPVGLDALLAELPEAYTGMPMEQLMLDSLGQMEFCIHLELDHGVVITPEDLLKLKTVDQLIALIQVKLP